MTKDLMIKEVAERATDIVATEGKKFTKKEVEAIIKAYVDCVIENLTNDKTEKVTLPGVGTFSVKHVNEKSGVAALAGGKAWTVPEHDEIKFIISKSVKTLA